jgi:uncharacterized protein YkwD
MVHRIPIWLLPACAALVVATPLLSASPVAGTAHASACQKFGSHTATKLNQHQARGAIRCLLNHRRQAHGLPRLRPDKRLSTAAAEHTRYMTSHACFEHRCPGELSPLSRLESVHYIVAGLVQWSYGENIAWGSRSLGTPEAIVKAWMHSRDHRRNILDANYEQVGVGFAPGFPDNKHGRGGTYTTDFGMRQDYPPDAPRRSTAIPRPNL